MKHIFIICLCLLTISCHLTLKKGGTESLKKELQAAEQAFSDASAQKGFYNAMLDVAANDIALFDTGDTVIRGMDFIKENIRKYPNGTKPPFSLTWKVEKTDVATSGDMGYTYGWYKMIVKDSLGRDKITKGLYNSVWKKINGVWKLVMD
ncbi:Ketosteroid isomerase homolog [Chitinophaga costaii]|uniref:Ketosteroid isomerase homolog n=1 Tax=Chitinophaga costaii TaxID=1335309 RepID=A0A1C4BAP6_9BACT|nr:nuclear transport factor 2 family protein [Chitinophaga costaii]PUZ27685.1 nuclear transport factor 2 family protein [Chitinophaga costaii]SCC03926.1 Ketosteroid isomerase homolog [Chitinophaga costaii]